MSLSPEPLVDGVSWSSVDATSTSSFSGTAAGCEIMGSRLHSVRFTGAVFDRWRLVDVSLVDCELSGVVLHNATFVRVRFQGCRMSGLVAPGLNGQDVQLLDCRIDGANLRSAGLGHCEFQDCDLTEADFYGAKLGATRLRRCRLAATDFTKASCRGLDLRGSSLERIRGAPALGGSVISSEQLVPLGVAVLGALGFRVDDEPEAAHA